MAKLVTVGIGIPAFNEGANIAFLLQKLLKQKTIGFVLKKIIVVSDGSTDNTVLAAKSVADKRIEVIENPIRVGQNQSQNNILHNCQQDILVILNADTLPAKDTFLAEIIKPIVKDKTVSLVGAETIPLPPQTIFEKILSSSHLWKNKISRVWQDGDNVLSCRGQARAFNKSFYQQLTWPEDVPEDAYSYFFCQQIKGKFIFDPKAKIYFRLPQNLQDHIKQSHRYFLGQKKLTNRFSKQLINQGYQIPLAVLVGTLISSLFQYHFYLLSYFLVMVYISWFMPQQISDASRFEIASSSKKLINE